MTDSEKQTRLKQFCCGGGEFLKNVAEDQLKDILKGTVKTAAGTAVGAALIGGMPIWPVALALAAGTAGLMVLKGKKGPESATSSKQDEIEELIQSLPSQLPTGDEFKRQAEQMDIKVDNVQESLEALAALLSLRTDRIFVQLHEQRDELRAFFEPLEDRLNMFESHMKQIHDGVRQILHVLTGGPHFTPFAENSQSRYLYSMARVGLYVILFT